MSNSGKPVAWVSRGGSGIGEAGAEALAAQGWTVVVSGRRNDALDAVVARISQGGGLAEPITLDVSIATEVEKAVVQILAKYGRIDSDQPDLEPWFYPDAGEPGLVKMQILSRSAR
jgi:NADP-dependent 3-hydroxy acid dehydrogenase YdfG